MARKRYGRQIAELIAGVVMLIVAAIGLAYGSLLRGMDVAAEDYSRGDTAGALQRYDGIERRLRSYGVIRLIPARDRRNLFLDESRLLYVLGRYDDAAERMERENEISGATSDPRYLLLRGQIAFRKSVKGYQESSKKDPRVLDEALHQAEDNLKDSLRLAPDDWDTKFDFEFVDYVRNLMNQSDKGKMKILMENVRVKEMKAKALAPEQQM